MSNLEVIKKFLNGEHAQTPLREIYSEGKKYKGRTLHTEKQSDRLLHLVNYKTTIARLNGDTVELNVNVYSRTTTKIQNMIKETATSKGLKIVEYIKI